MTPSGHVANVVGLLRLWAMFVMLQRRHARIVFATSGAFAIALSAFVVGLPGPAGASVGSDRADIAQLEKEIAAEGAHAQALVSWSNSVQARLYKVDEEIARSRNRLAADQRNEATAMSALRRLAIKAYVSGSAMNMPGLAMFSGTSSVAALLQQNQYVGAVNAKLDSALTTLQLDQAKTQDAQHALKSDQADAVKTLRELTAARESATTAIAANEAKLLSVHGDLRGLLAAAREQRRAAEVAAERALATARLSAPAVPADVAVAPPPDALPPDRSSTTSSVPSSVTRPPTPPVAGPGPTPRPSPPGRYANPLRSVNALSPQRIDQGVDYTGFGPIYAIGNGVVLNTVGSGWPGGTFIAYRLTDGPARGLVVFAAEDIQPSVQVGDTVTADSVLGHMYTGPDGIEMGWADGSSIPDAMARTAGQYDGSNTTAFGDNFSQLLVALGAPGGTRSGPPNGTLPAGWPRW